MQLVFLRSKMFDTYSAPLGLVAKSPMEVFLNLAQTLAFVAYRTAMGDLFRVLWILPESINPILCI